MNPILRSAALLPLLIAASAAERLTLEPGWHFLGRPGQPEYAHFHAHPITGPELSLTFTAQPNEGDAALFLRQSDVKESWNIQLNGKPLGHLLADESPLQHVLPIPRHGLRAGANTLHLKPAGSAPDTIRVGDVFIDTRPLADAMTGASLDIRVEDADDGTPLPARLTITDQDGCLTPIQAGPGQSLAVRPGVAYTGDGKAVLRLQPGRYTLHATRGFEYSLATGQVDLAEGERRAVHLRLRREVDTSGWISCDTHVHTVTHSRHGDATVQERVLTLAGEGIELPVATDHNTLADYEPAARELGVRRWFTPVIGDEVTTQQSHFNVFPVVPGSRIPDFRIGAWPALLENIRATPGVSVVILNHPHNIHNGFRPFDRRHFNPVTGQPRAVLDFRVDAMEIVSSSAQQSDPMIVVHDWFAMLNGGHRVVGLGSSDVHDVNRYIVGQGRTYVRVADADPGNIDVAMACRRLREGHALISMGLLVDLSVDGRYGVGDLAVPAGTNLHVTATIKGPSWIEADKVELYANGHLLRSRRLAVPNPVPRPGGVIAEVTFELPRPGHDIHLVAIATGPGITEPYWPIARPYQPRTPFWSSRVIGATNPVWVDADGDGTFASARALAARLVKAHGSDPARLLAALADHHESVSAHAAAFLEEAGVALDSRPMLELLSAASHSTRNGFSAFLSGGRPLPD